MALNLFGEQEGQALFGGRGGAERRVLPIRNLTIEGLSSFGGGSQIDPDKTLIIDRDFTVKDGSSTQLTVRGNMTTATGSADHFAGLFAPDGMLINSGNVHARVGSVSIEKPNITLTSGSVTQAASLFIKDAPTAGGLNYALLVEDGATRLKGTLQAEGLFTASAGAAIIGNTSLTGDLRFVGVRDLDMNLGTITDVTSIGLQEITSSDNDDIVVTLGTDSGDDFRVGNNNVFVVEGDNDRVGIGTQSPAVQLDVVQSTAGGTIRVSSSTLNQATSGKIVWAEATTERFDLELNANVDILELNSSGQSTIWQIVAASGSFVQGYAFTVNGETTLNDQVTITDNLDCEGISSFGNGSALLSRFTMRVDRDFTATATSTAQIQSRGIITVTGGSGAITNTQIDPSGTVINSGETHSTVSSLSIDEPVITVTSGAIDTAATLYIQRAPTEASDNFALLVDSGDSAFDGDLYFRHNNSGLLFGEIYAQDANDTITISSAGKANKVQIDTFDTNGASNGMTPDHTNDHITASKSDGMYMCTVSMSISSTGGSAYQIGTSVWKNNGATEFANLHSHRNMGGGSGDAGSVSMSGIIDVAFNETIEVWIWNETNTNNIIIEDVTLTLIQIGGT